MITTLIICITIVITIAFICSVYVNIKRQQICNQRDLDEYKTICIYTKDSAINDVFTIKKLIDKIDIECIYGNNVEFIKIIKEILEDYTEEEKD